MNPSPPDLPPAPTGGLSENGSSHNRELALYDTTCYALKGHASMLHDRVRNDAFFRALKQHVTSDAAVLDIGSGTGLWAIVAAKLGARRVVAIERDPLLVGLIKRLAMENGVSQIEVFQGDSSQIQLGNEFDIVLSETIGNLGFDEDIVAIMHDARERFLKRGGILIPDSVALFAAPGRFEGAPFALPAEAALNYTAFESVFLNVPVELKTGARCEFLGPPQLLARVDLGTLQPTPDLTQLSGRWRFEETSHLNCFAVWAEARLADGVMIQTADTTSWTPVIYRIRNFQARAGEAEFKLSLTRTCNYWTATLFCSGGDEVQSYSPAFAASTLLASTRLAAFNIVPRFDIRRTSTPGAEKL